MDYILNYITCALPAMMIPYASSVFIGVYKNIQNEILYWVFQINYDELNINIEEASCAAEFFLLHNSSC